MWIHAAGWGRRSAAGFGGLAGLLAGGVLAAAEGAVTQAPALATASSLAGSSAIIVDTVAPDAPTALTLTPTGGTVVANALPANNVRELVALAKAQPGKINYASNGIGSGPHLSGELFRSLAGIDIVRAAQPDGSGTYYVLEDNLRVPSGVSYMLENVVQEQTQGRQVSADLQKQLEEHYRPGVERSIRREILLIALAKQEGLEVTQDEITQQILRMQESDPRNASRVRQHYSSPERRASLAEAILESPKVVLSAQIHRLKGEKIAEMKAQGKTSKAPLTESFAHWGNAKVVLQAILGATAGQGVVWYAGQFYALFFLTQTLKVDATTANILIAISLAIGTPFFIVFGALSDRIGRKPIILGGCLIDPPAYAPMVERLAGLSGQPVELVPVGKAYFGFTDQELGFLDRWIRNHTTARFGPVREVEKALVLEVAFDAAQLSNRHKSGVALRFPRISRLRTDKPAAEADRIRRDP